MKSTPARTRGILFPAPFDRPLIRGRITTDRLDELDRGWKRECALLRWTSSQLIHENGKLRAQHRADAFRQHCMEVELCGISGAAWGWEILRARWYLHVEHSGTRRRQHGAFLKRAGARLRDELAASKAALASIEADPATASLGMDPFPLQARCWELETELADLEEVQVAGQYGPGIYERNGENPNKPVETSIDRHLSMAVRCLVHSPCGPGRLKSIAGAAAHVGGALEHLGADIGADAIGRRVRKFRRRMTGKSLIDEPHDPLPRRFLL